MAKFFIETYGCQMNIAESDSLKKIMARKGHEEVHSAEDADWVILNTCSVRTTAENRIVGRIGYFRGLNKQSDKKIKLVLMGCMGQNVGEEVKKQFPDVVKLVWGTYHKEKIADFISGQVDVEQQLSMEQYEFMPSEAEKTAPFKAFVPISHGCNNFCAYCIVPYVRGREVHRPVNDILDNVKRLYEEGVREISLLGQNVNSYIDGDIDFPKLLALIAEKSNMPRIGFLTSHPKDFSEALADVIASHENIMPMVHLPFQAGSNSVLKRMNRKYTREDYIKKIEIAKKIPDVVLTTDIMVGFPGESEEDFEQTLDIVKRVAFHEAYMYRYNQRPGTRAESFNDQVPEEIKLERLDRLIKIQNEITANLLNKEVGKTHLCLFENISKRNKKELIGRTHNGLRVVVEAEATQTGKIYRVKINGLAGNTLKAAVVNRT